MSTCTAVECGNPLPPRTRPNAYEGGQALGRRQLFGVWKAEQSCEARRGRLPRRSVQRYQPGYDGLPGGAQGLRALRAITITITITITIKITIGTREAPCPLIHTLTVPEL